MAGAGRQASSEAAMGPGSPRFLLRSFKRILRCNNAALTRMGQMDRALSGEYVFDKAFLDTAVRDVCDLTHATAYHLSGMAGEGFVELYDAYVGIKDALDDILSGGLGPLAGHDALDFDEIGLEAEPLVGLSSVGLAVLGRRMGLPAPDGLAVTATGMARLAGPQAQAVLDRTTERIEALFARLGGPRTLELTLAKAGVDGPGAVLEQAAAGSTGLALETLRQWAVRHAGASVAAHLCPAPEAVAEGTLQTLALDPYLPPAMLAVTREPGREAGGDRLFVSRTAPHEPLRSRVAVRPLDARLADGLVTDTGGGRSLRGSAQLTPAVAAELAGLGLAAERALGGPCLLGFVLDRQGRPFLRRVEPIATPFPDLDDDAIDLPGPDQAVLTGGQVACAGVGAGPVVVLDPEADPGQVPLGAVGVAKAAVPALARLVPRLGALLAETGTAASHLATVARENRVPAVFGIDGAMTLVPGAMVTVDASEAAVYPGVSQALLRRAALDDASLGREPEYLILRRLLRHIRPLHLIDPDDPGFIAANCRSCHDIVHFAHEKAVELLLSISPTTGETSGLAAARRFKGDTPLALSILDLGGGLVGESGEAGLDQVESKPLRAFLEGLTMSATQRQGPGRLSMGDILSGLGRTSALLSAPAGTSGLNLALAGADYANVTMRLGYHFSVVDAVAGDRPDHNFVYFRYAGGFADAARRARRAKLILSVLDRLGFKAEVKGDLVVGKRKLMEADEALDVLRLLGELTAFTRQLDLELTDDDEVERLMREFVAASSLANGGRP